MYKLISALAIIGIGLASFLLYEFLTLPAVSPCYINATINCDAATKGSLSTLLGIPVALYGLSGYVFILLAALKKWPRVIFGMALFGLLFCLRITFIEIFQLGVLCPVCLMCQLDMVALFVLSILLLKSSKPTLDDHSNNSNN